MAYLELNHHSAAKNATELYCNVLLQGGAGNAPTMAGTGPQVKSLGSDDMDRGDVHVPKLAATFSHVKSEGSDSMDRGQPSTNLITYVLHINWSAYKLDCSHSFRHLYEPYQTACALCFLLIPRETFGCFKSDLSIAIFHHTLVADVISCA